MANLSTAAEIRGASGSDVGTIGAPIFNGREDFTATAAQTEFSYAHDSSDAILVYINGALQASTAQQIAVQQTQLHQLAAQVLATLLLFLKYKALTLLLRE